MIPDPDVRERQPLSLGFVFLLAVLAPLAHLVAAQLLFLIGFRGLVPVVGMGALLAYGGIFALCAARFRLPPMQQLALVAPPRLTWLAALLLLPSMLLSSELDNWITALYPPPLQAPLPANLESPQFLVPTLAIVFVVILPLAYELLFRGVMQPLAVARLGLVAGIALTATLSAVAPAVTSSPRAIGPAFALALVLCILRQASGSLWPAIALHVVEGLARFAAQYEVFGIPGFDDMSAKHTPTAWLVGAAVSAGLGLIVCRVVARSRRA